jgi:hypothetical protein
MEPAPTRPKAAAGKPETPAAKGTPAPAPANATSEALAARIRAIEERARGLAASGVAGAGALAEKVMKLAERLVDESAEARKDALIEARRVLAGDHEKKTLELAELVPNVRIGLRDLLFKATNAAERKRVSTLMGVYGELEGCLKMIADAMITHSMARQRWFMAEQVAETAEKARAGVEEAKRGLP